MVEAPRVVALVHSHSLTQLYRITKLEKVTAHVNI
jgi:hypothetical protein